MWNPKTTKFAQKTAKDLLTRGTSGRGRPIDGITRTYEVNGVKLHVYARWTNTGDNFAKEILVSLTGYEDGVIFYEPDELTTLDV